MAVRLRSFLGRGRAGASSDAALLVAEVAQTHDGSLGLAHAFIDAIAEAGADAVKFQTHIAAAESTPAEPWRIPFSQQDADRYSYWKRMEFTPEQWLGLRRHADDRGLLFLSSPFSVEAVELLTRVGVAAWKIASGEAGRPALIDAIAPTGLPVLLSTGMSPLAETDAAVAQIRARGLPLTVLQCTSAYPCAPEEIGLNLLAVYRERYHAGVGLSDHSGSIYPGLAAAVLGAEVVEVHVTLSRAMFGPDVAASVTMSELGRLAEGLRWVAAMLGHPVEKDAVAARLGAMRALFTHSVTVRRDLPAGTVLGAEDLAARRPGTGIPEARLPELIGTTLARAVRADQLLGEADIGGLG